MNSKRQSIFPQQVPTELYWQSLDSCSQSLHATSTSLNNAIQTLQQGTYDFPRLQSVITTKRCFELVAEADVRKAQRSLADEIEPQIKELIARAESGLNELKTKEKTLAQRAEKRAAAVVTLHQTSSSSAATAKSNEERESYLRSLRARKLELSREGQNIEAEVMKVKRSLGNSTMH